MKTYELRFIVQAEDAQQADRMAFDMDLALTQRWPGRWQRTYGARETEAV